jgi:hypothetical protein
MPYLSHANDPQVNQPEGAASGANPHPPIPVGSFL